jgi:hypothetical protein
MAKYDNPIDNFVEGVRFLTDNFGQILTITIAMLSALALVISTFFLVVMSYLYLFCSSGIGSQIDEKRIAVFFYLTVGLVIIFLSSVFIVKYFFTKEK